MLPEEHQNLSSLNVFGYSFENRVLEERLIVRVVRTVVMDSDDVFVQRQIDVVLRIVGVATEDGHARLHREVSLKNSR